MPAPTRRRGRFGVRQEWKKMDMATRGQAGAKRKKEAPTQEYGNAGRMYGNDGGRIRRVMDSTRDRQDKRLRVGIPRGLLYHKYFPLWETFLRELGAEVVVSPATNRHLVNIAGEVAENELCVPVKVFYGHVLALKDKVDCLFIPRVVSVERNAYTCPKFLGLPDMIAALDDDLPPILSPTVDQRESRWSLYESAWRVGRVLTDSPIRILRAWRKSTSAYRLFQDRMQTGLTPVDVLEMGDGRGLGAGVNEAAGSGGAVNGAVTIGVAGHPYNVYDPYISMNLIKRLREKGANVVTGEMLPAKTIERAAEALPKHLFWTYEKEVVGAAFHWLKEKVDGIVYVLSFACGPDSIIQVLLEAEARDAQIALMPLVIDEHAGEAGVVTRVEAFMDMLNHKKALSA